MNASEDQCSTAKVVIYEELLETNQERLNYVHHLICKTQYPHTKYRQMIQFLSCFRNLHSAQNLT